MKRWTKEEIENRLTADERKWIFSHLGIDLSKGKQGNGGWINALYRPSELGDDSHPSFCINSESGAVTDHGSDYSGDLWKLIQDVKHISFTEAIDWVVSILHLETQTVANNWDPFKDGHEAETYTYFDDRGNEAFEVIRFEVDPTHPAYQDKTFRQRYYAPEHPKANKNGYVWKAPMQLYPYKLPQVLHAISQNQLIFIVEGEKDVETLAGWGLTATCNPGGAGKWKTVYSNYLKDAKIIVIPDNDEKGQKHAESVVNSIYQQAQLIKVISLLGLPHKGDITDWVNQGNTKEALLSLIEKQPPWKPSDNTPNENATPSIGVLVSDVQRESIKWLWPGRLALGKITILDGDPGTGKSTLYCDIAARITTGRGWPDNDESISKDQTGSVVIVTVEDGIGDTIKPRLEEAKADTSKCLVIQSIPGYDGEKHIKRTPILPEDLHHIKEALLRIRSKLLIIDPLFAHLSSKFNSFRDQDIRTALTPLAQMADELQVAVLVIRHLNKSSGGSAIYRGGGSIGIIGQARLGFMLGRHPEDEERLVLACTKSNPGKHPSSQALRIVASENEPEVGIIKWEGLSNLTSDDLLFKPSKRPTKAGEAETWLLEQLNDGEPHLAK